MTFRVSSIIHIRGKKHFNRLMPRPLLGDWQEFYSTSSLFSGMTQETSVGNRLLRRSLACW
jgi:hypothetical protein